MHWTCQREILRFAQNDRVAGFFRGHYSHAGIARGCSWIYSGGRSRNHARETKALGRDGQDGFNASAGRPVHEKRSCHCAHARVEESFPQGAAIRDENAELFYQSGGPRPQRVAARDPRTGENAAFRAHPSGGGGPKTVAASLSQAQISAVSAAQERCEFRGKNGK